MKTKPIHKKEKKQLQEGSFPLKLSKKSKTIVKSKKNPQKIKVDNTVQNGDSILKKPKVQVEKINKKKKKITVKQRSDENIEKLPRTKISEEAEEVKSTDTESKKKALSKKKIKKLEHLKNEQLVSETNEDKKGPRYRTNLFDIDIMRKKVAEIKSREVLTKTAKKKVAALLRKIAVVEELNESKKLETTKEENKNEHQANVKNKRKAKEEHDKNKKAKFHTKQDNESDDDNQNNMEDEEEEKDIEEEADTESFEDEEGNIGQKDDKSTLTKMKKAKKESKKKRFVLFAGNLPYE